jgi:hypothetical protein
MRATLLRPAALVFTFAIACGTTGSGSGSTAPGSDGGTTPVLDAGPSADGGTAGTPDAGGGTGGGGGVDAGTGAGGGGTDGGTASACDGLAPAAVGAPVQIQTLNNDLVNGVCEAAEVDGTGHIATTYELNNQPHSTSFTFFDPAGTRTGSYGAIRAHLIGQASGFMGAECIGARCQSDVFVLDPNGGQLFKSNPGVNEFSNGLQANNPLGGMIHARLQNTSAGSIVVLDNLDATGAVRWSRTLPDPFAAGAEGFVQVAVDRMGNTLALWASTARFGANTWAGEWFDPAGNAGPVFEALTGVVPTQTLALFDRVGSGLFLSDGFHWIGQIDALATGFTAAPPWLVTRINTTLHMARGGTAYAVVPLQSASANCEQTIELVAADGTSCGSATFTVGGGACDTTGPIVVGYDGTVVQELPSTRETCTAANHQCTCTYHAWPAFFR